MAIDVCWDPEAGVACLYTLSGHALGHVFHGPDADAQAHDFIEWLEVDPRQFSDAELDAVYYEWREARVDVVSSRLRPKVLAERSVG